MKRKKKKEKVDRVDAILTADWHIMEHQPPCRTDNFFLEQFYKMDQISILQEKYNCPVLHAGDLTEKARPSLYLVKLLMSRIPNKFFTILGNHDLPNHNIELFEKCAIALLSNSDKLTVLPFKHYGEKEYEECSLTIKNKEILITHEMVWQGKSPWPGCTDPEIHELFDMYPDADLILSGHNHKTMTVEQDGRLIVNPGSLTRHKADQTEHRPCVFLYDSIKNKAVPHYLKINADVMSREHIEVQKSKDLRLQKFIDNLKINDTKNISFEKNVERLLKDNKVSNKMETIIQGWME